MAAQISDLQLEKLKSISDSLNYKDSIYLTFTANKSVFTTTFDTPHKLNSNRNYEHALHYFTTSNYQTNVNETNNKFHYSYQKPNTNTWTDYVITFEKGAYEIKDINSDIIRHMKKNIPWDDNKPSFDLSIKLSTFKSVIEIKSDKIKVDFTKPKTIRTLLGFDAQELTVGYHESDNTVQITSASSILIKCSITGGSYHNGKETNTLFSFPAYLVPVGYKINIIPPSLIYLPLNTNVLSRITFEIMDNNGNILDFKDENMALAMHIRQV